VASTEALLLALLRQWFGALRVPAAASKGPSERPAPSCQRQQSSSLSREATSFQLLHGATFAISSLFYSYLVGCSYLLLQPPCSIKIRVLLQVTARVFRKLFRPVSAPLARFRRCSRVQSNAQTPPGASFGPVARGLRKKSRCAGFPAIF
jgi:hypothetical protein